MSHLGDAESAVQFVLGRRWVVVVNTAAHPQEDAAWTRFGHHIPATVSSDVACH
jgi:hypothetical protein